MKRITCLEKAASICKLNNNLTGKLNNKTAHACYKMVPILPTRKGEAGLGEPILGNESYGSGAACQLAKNT